MTEIGEQNRSAIQLEHKESKLDLGEIPLKRRNNHLLVTKKFCSLFVLLGICILLSFFTSVITTKFLLNSASPIREECIICDKDEENTTKTGVKQCCNLPSNGNVLPEASKQIQEKPVAKVRIGAQLSVNQDLLEGNSSQLVWSHLGPDDYLEGVRHVTHYFMNFSYDCLEVSQAGRYLITVQLTYQYKAAKTNDTIESYFTLTRFRNSEVHVVAKNDHVVPENSLSVTMVRSDPLKRGDRLCITVLRPDLIYASSIDNFFGIVSL